MMLPNQLDLLSWKGPGARRADPDTSQLSAAKFRPRKDHEDVLRVLAEFGASTDFEISAHLGRVATSVGKRRGELRDAGLVIDSGERRPSPSGSSAIVWKLRE